MVTGFAALSGISFVPMLITTCGGAVDARPAPGAGRLRWARCAAGARPDLPEDIDDNPRPLDLADGAAGLHFLIPIGTLIWCLMVEEMSPALSAFWASPFPG